MSKICSMLRDLIKDEKEAVSEYNKLKLKMLGHTNQKEIIDKIIVDETDHYKKIKELAKEHGCKL